MVGESYVWKDRPSKEFIVIYGLVTKGAIDGSGPSGEFRRTMRDSHDEHHINSLFFNMLDYQ